MESLFLIFTLIGLQHSTEACLSSTILYSPKEIPEPKNNFAEQFKFDFWPQPRATRKAGEVLDLHCSVISSPPAHIYWLKNSVAIFSHAQDSIRQILNPKVLYRKHSVMQVEESRDGDNFTCVAETGTKKHYRYTLVYNEETNVNRPIDATVKITEPDQDIRDSKKLKAPRIVTYYDAVEDMLDANLKLLCRANGFPPPNITWHNNKNKEITPGFDRMKVLPTGELVIFPLTKEDFGGFRCVATNTVGKDEVLTVVFPGMPNYGLVAHPPKEA